MRPIPDIETLKQESTADLIAAFDGDLGVLNADGQLALIAGSIEEALAAMTAGQTFGLYTLEEHIARQATPATATLNTSDDPWGLLQDWGISFSVPYGTESGSVGTIDAVFDGATTVLEGTQFRANNGETFTVTIEKEITEAGTFELDAESDGTGPDTNLGTGAQLTAVTSVVNMQDAATVGTDGFTGGQDDDEQEPYRTRVLAGIRAPDVGSSDARYRLAALSVPGVTRAFVTQRAPTVGALTVHFMMDEIRSANNGIPQGTDGIIPTVEATGDQKLVADAITSAKIRPPAADVHVNAPVALPVTTTLSNLTPDTTDVRAAVTAEVRRFYQTETAPGKRLAPSQISSAISAANGEESHILSSPAAEVLPAAGEIPILENDVVNFP